MSSGDFEIGKILGLMVLIMIRCHLIWRRLQLMLKKYKSKLVVMQTYYMNIVATSFMSFREPDMGSRA